MGYTHRFIFGIENGTTTDPLTRCEVPVIHADVIVEAGKGSYLPPGNAYDCAVYLTPEVYEPFFKDGYDELFIVSSLGEMYAWACTKAEEYEDGLYFKILRDTARAYMESDWGRERIKVVHWGN